MRRVPALLLLLPCLTVLALGCTKARVDPIHGNLVLLLPESEGPPKNDKKCLTKLTVNGKDYSEPRAEKRTLQVQTEAGSDEVTIEFSYWPKQYTNRVRTKVVKLEKDKTVEVDLRSEDPNRPDLIKPIYVPTPKEVVAEMCKLGKVGADDVVYDIGCGHGLMVLQAVKDFGAKRGVGIEIDTDKYEECLQNRRRQGLDDKVEFRCADALTIKDYSDATVVLLYVGEDLGEKLAPILRQSLKPGARIVSHRFLLGSNWPPDETQKIKARDNDESIQDFELHIWHIKKK